MEIITYAGEALKAEKQASGEPLIIDQFILAFIPGQDASEEIDRTRGLPDIDNVVYTPAVTRSAYVADNEVVYSLFMGSNIGPFAFNTLYLVCTQDNDTVFAISTLPDTQKVADSISSGVLGVSMTRNFMLAFDDAKDLTELNVEAESWQIEFNSANETVRGIAEIATHAEAQAGQDDQRIVTPLKLNGFWNSVRMWDNIENKPEKYPPEEHTHDWSDISNLPESGYVEDVRIGVFEWISTWNQHINSYLPGHLIIAIYKGAHVYNIEQICRAPIQKKIEGIWYTVETGS